MTTRDQKPPAQKPMASPMPLDEWLAAMILQETYDIGVHVGRRDALLTLQKELKDRELRKELLDRGATQMLSGTGAGTVKPDVSSEKEASAQSPTLS